MNITFQQWLSVSLEYCATTLVMIVVIVLERLANRGGVGELAEGFQTSGPIAGQVPPADRQRGCLSCSP